MKAIAQEPAAVFQTAHVNVVSVTRTVQLPRGALGKKAVRAVLQMKPKKGICAYCVRQPSHLLRAAFPDSAQ